MRVFLFLALLLVLGACSLRNLQIQGLGNSEGSVIIAFDYVALPGWVDSTISFNITLNGETVHSFSVDDLKGNKGKGTDGKDPRQKSQKFRMMFPVNEGSNSLTIGVGQGMSLTGVAVAQKHCCGPNCNSQRGTVPFIEGNPEAVFPLAESQLNTELEVVIEAGCLMAVQEPVPPPPAVKTMLLSFSVSTYVLGAWMTPQFDVLVNDNTYPVTIGNSAQPVNYFLNVDLKVGVNTFTFSVHHVNAVL